MDNKIYAGLFWALTDSAKEQLTRMVSNGFDYDLAFSLLDQMVRDGVVAEQEVYQLPTPEKESEVLRETA